ncbi:MAG: TetR/AcrR family transcriptional regulator [Candidatus Promineifilaceae bacterium]
MNRLNKEQWLDHGLRTLASAGPTALKADRLAKSLGVSRGSFYWHFTNLADFHSGVLRRWQQLTVEAAVDQLEITVADATARLKALISLAAQDKLALEHAIRVWADSKPEVKQAVEAVDAQRLAYLETVFAEMGLSSERAYARARVVYYAFLGQMVIAEVISAENKTKLTRELIHLATI